MSRDELISNVGEVIAHELRLRADRQNIVADSLDQGGLPAGRNGTEGVPRVTSDKTKLGRFDAKLAFDVGITLGRWLVAPHGLYAESLLEEFGNSAVFELLFLHFYWIVGESE